jgi:hypothetical protein
MKTILVKKKYKPVRIPIDVYEDAVNSQKKMNETATELTGKPTRIPLTKVFRIKMRAPIVLPDDLLKKLARGKNVF